MQTLFWKRRCATVKLRQFKNRRNRLCEVCLPDGRRARYTYDAFGRRVSKQIAPRVTLGADGTKVQATEFLWDGDALAAELDGEQLADEPPRDGYPLVLDEAGAGRRRPRGDWARRQHREGGTAFDDRTAFC